VARRPWIDQRGPAPSAGRTKPLHQPVGKRQHPPCDGRSRHSDRAANPQLAVQDRISERDPSQRSRTPAALESLQRRFIVSDVDLARSPPCVLCNKTGSCCLILRKLSFACLAPCSEPHESGVRYSCRCGGATSGIGRCPLVVIRSVTRYAPGRSFIACRRSENKARSCLAVLTTGTCLRCRSAAGCGYGGAGQHNGPGHT
jgi:hypothetical protein